MCGIVGYIGQKNCVPILLEGLRRLEYRGYDSAGIALIKGGCFQIEKKAGKVSDLAEAIRLLNGSFSSGLGMGHTRWATHGEPNDANAHPHWDATKQIAIIHNGIIENYSAIRTKLVRDGHKFTGATDTEVLAHLIGAMYDECRDLTTAVRHALAEVEGTYGLVVLSVHEPDKMIAARKGSPLILGIGEGENYVASDASAIVDHTRNVVYLDDGEIAVVTRDGFRTVTIDDVSVTHQVEEVTLELSQIERGGYDHFMLKEIHEQPDTIMNAMRGRLLVEQGNVVLGGLRHVMDKLLCARRFVITACGTSWHAGLVGKYMFEQIAKMPTKDGKSI